MPHRDFIRLPALVCACSQYRRENRQSHAGTRDEGRRLDMSRELMQEDGTRENGKRRSDPGEKRPLVRQREAVVRLFALLMPFWPLLHQETTW